MLKLLRVAAAALLFCGTHLAALPAVVERAAAQAPVAACRTWERFLVETRSAAQLARIEVLAGETAQAFLKAWNEAPPRTDFHGDEIRIGHFRNGSVGVAILEKGCVRNAGMVEPAVLRAILQKLGAET